MDIGSKEIRKWHLDRGWKDIGYNLVIRRNGALEAGRDLDHDGDWLEETGAHAMGFNKNSIGICLVGGVDADNEPDNNFTREQFAMLKSVITIVRNNWPDINIKGHRDLPGVKKACPCFDVKDWMEAEGL